MIVKQNDEFIQREVSIYSRDGGNQIQFTISFNESGPPTQSQIAVSP